MLCPTCRADDTRVVDSRLASEGAAIRRRRECLACRHRFTTYERVEEQPLVVVKSTGEHELFDRSKIVRGVEAACKGRAVAGEQIAELACSVEDEVRLLGSEVTSSQVGLTVLDRLRALDEVAYLRFASVYKNFDAASDFQSELDSLSKLTHPTV